MRFSPLSLTLAVCLALVATRYTLAAEKAEPAKNDRVVKDGMLVSMEYTLKGTDGKVIESSKGKEPLKYIHGTKTMIPGLERELSGMKVGGEKNVTVKPEDAYGPVRKEGFHEVPRDKVPAEGLKVGTVLYTKSPEGQTFAVRVHEIKEKTVIMDGNHPMAGKTLLFDIKIVDIQPAPPPPAPAKSAGPAAPAKPAAPAQPAKPAEPAKK